jgi:hypothetical protein
MHKSKKLHNIFSCLNTSTLYPGWIRSQDPYGPKQRRYHYVDHDAKA